MKPLWAALTILVLSIFVTTTAPAQSLEFKQGDHICIIGNALGDRMQHHGWLEARLVSRFGDKDLTFRNLAVSGDEITFRHRSESFGTPDEWLTRCKADVIFAMFGYNESFAGEAGLPKFKTDLETFVKGTLATRYGGKDLTRLVIFSPLAVEKLADPNLPDAAKTNANLKLYSAAMGEVAKANKVPFVDLFTISEKAYSGTTRPYTFNGIHLTEFGDEMLASSIERALLPDAPLIKRDGKLLEKIRLAILEKNAQWHARYRTVDGYNVYGGRSKESYQSGPGGPKISNFQIMQEEMKQRDVLTENRDKHIWSIAKGSEQPIDDSNLPPITELLSNRQNLPPYLGAEEAIKHMTVPKNCKVNLFASEEQFPELVSPVQMGWDTKGRLWVAAWKSYPERTPTSKVGDAILIFEDTDGDGRADKCKHFIDNLNCPTGFTFFNDGVLLMQAPDLWFVRDTDGDDKADWKERVLMGIDSADSHHTTNAMVLDPGGATYLSDGVFHRTQVETRQGVVRSNDGCIFRYEPLTGKFEQYVSYGFANPHGRVFDRWGNDIITDATGNENFFGPAFSGYLPYPQKHSGMPQFWARPNRPCPGTGMVTSRHFPEDWQGNFLNCNVIGYQGIWRVKVTEEGSGLKGETLSEDLVKSDDPNFRPSAVSCAPDGSIYFLDWSKQLIGHLQHHIRDPNRDHQHGRVYRITYEGRPLLTPPKVFGESVDGLLALLQSPEDDVRTRAKVELGKHNSIDVIPALHKWAAGLDKKAPNYEHHLSEALWVHQWHNVVDQELLEERLKSPDHRSRAAATRVLCYWRDRVPNVLDLLRKMAADQHPRVRLEAIRAASFFTLPEAAEIPIIAAEFPGDVYLDYIQKETMRALQPYVDQANASGQKIAFTTDAGARYFLKSMSTDDLLKEKRTRAVYTEMLYRPGLRDEQRREAVTGLAGLDKKPELRVVMDMIKALDESPSLTDVSVVFDLVRQLTGRSAAELTSARAELEKLATSARQPILRQIGFVSLINVDGNADKAWALAQTNAKALQDFVAATPLVSDPGLRASLYPRIELLLTGLPEKLATGKKGNGTSGRYVRVELVGNQTLTLAEVEVYSDGASVARGKKATQKNTSHGGEAARGVDGNTNDSYGGGGQTHSEENTANPWWEVDLGEETPIDSIVIFNRNDGGLSQRLNNFTLKVLDSARSEVWKQEKLPAPKVRSQFALEGGGSESLVRRAAMNALVSVRGQEVKTFKSLSKFVTDDVDRLAAIRAIQRIPQSAWDKEQAPALLAVVIGHVKKIPVADRTSPAALDALEFADTLTTLLSADAAKQARGELAELGVKVVRIGTLPEKMAYDKEIIAVKAGKAVEIVFENIDLMPHNLVITQPGAMEEIGLAAEASALQPGAAARQYVPQSGKILLASRLLQPRETQKLSFVAPTEPGVYPYVCTYPGHWRRMYGALYVVADLDAYLAGPEAYLSTHPLPIKDALLKDNRPRTEWKLVDLAPAAEGLKSGRSYAAGKQMFTVGTCIACHKLDGVGNEFGPDLAKLDLKLKPADILKELLEPSAKINEKYQTTVILTEGGQTLTGIVLSESGTEVKLIENPLVKAEPIIIKKDEIQSRKLSPTSVMPKGLLDKLSKEEILDLVAYLAARGDKKSPMFGKAEGHEHHGH
ncbi:MAG: PVC-type heme-binding CxxCH protein [Pirellulaceae bacterium]